ncbi:MAG TPA: hypothetical protein VFB80_16420 [Pirellulaceae bacterium]|nr:hypothetical protein [Pirellulaceae bacterium]
MDESSKKSAGQRQASSEPWTVALHRRLSRAWWYFAIPIVTFLMLGFGCYYWATWPARQVADDFQQSLAWADYARAFSLCSPELQKLGNAEKLEQIAEASGEFYRPWAWDSGAWEGNRVQLNAAGSGASRASTLPAAANRRCGCRSRPGAPVPLMTDFPSRSALIAAEC